MNRKEKNNNEYDEMMNFSLPALDGQRVADTRLGDKTCYQVYPCETGKEITFEDFDLFLGGYNVTRENEGYKHVAYIEDWDRDCSFVMMMLNDVFCDEDSKGEVRLTLYRRGEPQPLATQVKKVYESSKDISYDLEVIDFEPGDYFLRIDGAKPEDESAWQSIGESVEYPFVVLETGEKRNHPVVVAPNLKVKKALVEEDREMPVFEYRQRGLFSWEDEYAVYCYADDFTLIAKDSQQGGRHTGGQSELKMKWRLETKRIWQPGTYHLVLAHNRVPFYVIPFEWTSQGCRLGKGCQVDEKDIWYPLVREVAVSEQVEVKRLFETYGTGDMRRRVLECWKQRNIYRASCQKGLEPYVANRFFVCDGNYEQSAWRVYPDFAIAAGNWKDVSVVDLAGIEDWDSIRDQIEDRDMLLFYNLDDFCGKWGDKLMGYLEEKLYEEVDWGMMLIGRKAEVEALLQRYPILKPFFATGIHARYSGEYTDREKIYSVEDWLQLNGYSLSNKAKSALLEGIVQCGDIKWGYDTGRRLVREGMLQKHAARMTHLMAQGVEHVCKKDMQTIEVADIDFDAFIANSQEKDLFKQYKKSTEQLNQMIGLDEVKQMIIRTANRVLFNQARREKGLNVLADETHHMIFCGNPGTGKTTVAKMIGAIFHSLGILSKGEVVVTERTSLVGQYIGETEEKMMKVLEKAKGNVLFIDEAYTLYNGAEDSKDFGKRVIESLLTFLAQKSPDMIVILAGYEKEMQQLIDSNDGLRGRFPHHLHFPDYSVGELMQIANNRLGKENLVLSEDALRCMQEIVFRTLSRKSSDFSNARWIEQFVAHGILPAMADRVIAEDRLESVQACTLVLPADVENGYRLITPVTEGSTCIPLRRKIGFRACS